MPTNKWGDSSWWSNDSLLWPQSHPVRNAHDTFFITAPVETVSFPPAFYDEVKMMHEVGGSGPVGHRYDVQEAHKNLLLTRTVTSLLPMLCKLVNQEGGGRLWKRLFFPRINTTYYKCCYPLFFLSPVVLLPLLIACGRYAVSLS